MGKLSHREAAHHGAPVPGPSSHEGQKVSIADESQSVSLRGFSLGGTVEQPCLSLASEAISRIPLLKKQIAEEDENITRERLILLRDHPYSCPLLR